jgi:type IV pilus assembly protein PilY1
MRRPQKNTKKLSLRRRILARATPVICAYLATLLAIPLNAAITLPTEPLTTGARVPPNVLFILDNSGSMSSANMPDNVPSTSSPNIASAAYTRNTIYYNPATNYLPWTKADGTLMTGGTDYGAAYSSNEYVNYTGTGPGGSGTISTTSDVVNLSDAVRTFYVPYNTESDAEWGDGTKYYRYQILTDRSIQRSVYGTVVASNPRAVSVSGGGSGTLSNSNEVTLTLEEVPANVVLNVTISNTTPNGSGNRNLTVVLRNPSGAQVNTNNVGRGSSRSYEVSPTLAGRYTLALTRDANNNTATTYSVTATRSGTNACDSSVRNGSRSWINCEPGRPNSRSVEAELTNFATWYSYHRTRYKAAKAGASQAFAGLGDDVRVGFRTIQNDTDIPSALRNGNMPTPAVPIPVAYNDGLFSDSGTTANARAYNNRTQWYNRLFTTKGGAATPLRQSLTDAGNYFSSSAANGPYGPASGVDQLSCRQNFTIMTTDGYWNEGGYNNARIGDADNTPGETITHSVNRTTYRYDPAEAANAPYPGGLVSGSDQSNGTPTLADVAMYYWKSDLRADLDNIVPTNSKDLAFWQHMTTFTIGLGLVGTVNEESVDQVIANRGASYTSGGQVYRGWPAPVNNSITAVDDLLHAAVNGHGTYVAATNPRAFTDGLRAALASVTERTGSFSNVAANSTSVDGGTLAFRASYLSGLWTGELAAYGVSQQNGVAAAPTWRASERIPTTNRKLFTSDGVRGLAFPASATRSQLEALARTGTSGYPVSGENNAAYIAGSRQLEVQNGGNLRNRNHLLGDIVSSSPAYVSDTDTLYVGANDGMLHAFNASSGSELFGFIPNGINWSSLGTLSRPDYAHRFFVDGPVVVSSRVQTPNKNILVGALGKGGKGLFALDVTDPASFNTNKFKWEVGSNDVDMGLVESRPIIARLNNGQTAVVVSNGLNSVDGHAVLLIYNLDTGNLIKRIDTEVGSAVAESPDSNGLTQPVGWDADGSGTVDYVYAGDMLGNVWKFNLSAASTANWGVAGNAPIFSATYPTENGQVRQPITGGITVAMHPTTYQPWIFFGTGRLMTPGDLTNRAVQSVYGFVEDGSVKRRNGGSKNLTARSLVVSDSAAGTRAFEPNAPLPSDSKGWYLDLLTPPNATIEGERVVSETQLLNDALVFSSVIPTASACLPDGRGYLNVLDAFTGTSTTTPFFDANRNGNFSDDTLSNGDDKLPIGSISPGVGMPTLANLLRGQAIVGGSSGNSATVPIKETRNVGRVSWREVKRGDE